MSFIVGLTGGIGSGKSAAAERFAALGAQIIDTDAIAHALTGPDGEAMPAITAAFGPDVRGPDGALDRATMRQRVFADPAERTRLEAILHPRIRAAAEAQLGRPASAKIFPYAVLVVPLLVERSGWRDRVDRIAVVDCPEALQIERVMQRGRLSRDAVAAILAAQATRAERLAVADDVIPNGGSLEALWATVDRLDRDYRQLAGLCA